MNFNYNFETRKDLGGYRLLGLAEILWSRSCLRLDTDGHKTGPVSEFFKESCFSFSPDFPGVGGVFDDRLRPPTEPLEVWRKSGISLRLGLRATSCGTRVVLE